MTVATQVRRGAHSECVADGGEDWRARERVQALDLAHAGLEVEVQEAKGEEDWHEAGQHKGRDGADDRRGGEQLQDAVEPAGGKGGEVAVDVVGVLGEAVDDAARGVRVEEGERCIEQRVEHLRVQARRRTQAEPAHLELRHHRQQHLRRTHADVRTTLRNAVTCTGGQRRRRRREGHTWRTEMAQKIERKNIGPWERPMTVPRTCSARSMLSTRCKPLAASSLASSPLAVHTLSQTLADTRTPSMST